MYYKFKPIHVTYNLKIENYKKFLFNTQQAKTEYKSL